jgi:hypothetical protein
MGLGLITAGSQTNTPTLHEGNTLHRMVMMALGQQRFRGGEKILANFEIAAVHASHMLKVLVSMAQFPAQFPINETDIG